MILSMVTVEKENVDEKMFELFKFDQDITGEDCVDPKAKELGFHTTLDFFIHKAKDKTNNHKEVAQKVVEQFTQYPENKGFYKKMTVKFEEIEDKIVVAFSAL